MTPLEPGELLDHYRIDAIVARSAMSILYRATDLENNRLVAVKVPLAEMEEHPVLLERFRREEEIGQLLDHPGIVKTIQGEGRSRHYMVIEWVEGRLLRAILEEGRLPAERAVRITRNICEALDALHKHGIVHRDLKPENIMVGEDDAIKIIDFGIALKEDARRLTLVGMPTILGTPDYISPELAQGQHGDQRSDIYSLGIMLYEMLTGRVPFSGDNPLAIIHERVNTSPPPPRSINPEITPELEEIVFRALERNPRHRYSTAHEMAWDLEHQEQVGISDRPALHIGERGISRKTLLYAVMVIVPAALFGLMLLLAKR